MSVLKERLKTEMKEAMKAKDKTKLETVRQILAAAQYESMEKKVEDLDDAGYTAVIQRELKKRHESIDFAKQGKREDLLAPLLAEVTVLESFLPKMATAQDIEVEVQKLKAATPGVQMGVIMKALKEKFGATLDGKVASEVCKKVL